MLPSEGAGGRWRSAAPALFAILVWSAVPADALELRIDGPETVLFDQRTDACDVHHHPDAPARAFRNNEGRMVLFAPNFHNRAHEGANLRSLSRDCALRFKAANSPEPERLDDRSWLHAFHTEDGRSVFALASASFIPYRHGTACEAGDHRTDCWFNGIVALSSDDGGRSFEYMAPPPRHTVFPPPAPYRPDVADPPGFITATNIVPHEGHLYSIVWQRGATREKLRNCLVRAPDDDPTRWSILAAGEFVPAASFSATGWTIHSTECDRVGPRGLSSIRGLVVHEPSGTFVAVYQHRRRDAEGNLSHGIFYSTSDDMRDWSMPQLLMQARLRPDAGEGDSYVSYPSVIDDRSPDRNFATIGDRADLLFVRIVRHREGGEVRRIRQLVAVPISADVPVH